MKPQLLNELKAGQSVSGLLLNDKFAMSQKLDGKRLLFRTGLNPQAWGRNGLATTPPPSILMAFRKVQSGWAFDGELIGEDFYVFDLVELKGQSIASKPWSDRQSILTAVLTDFSPCVRLVPQKLDSQSKLSHYEDCRGAGSEGVVFCNKTSRYKFGLRSSQSLKYKFVKTIDCVVIDLGVNGKDNLVLGLYENGELIDVGKVSSLTGDGANYEFKIGDVVTVKYLYGTDSRRLYQPVSPILRKDKEPEECLMSQMIMKGKKIL